MKWGLVGAISVLAPLTVAADLAPGEEDAVRLKSTVPLPSRVYNWTLPAQPNHPSLPLPRFQQETILPTHVRFDTISKTGMMPENLRPWHLENRLIMMNALVRDSDIRPQHLLDTAPSAPPKPPRVGHTVIDKPYAGSMIFLPSLPPPADIHRARPIFKGPMPSSGHRRLLGW